MGSEQSIKRTMLPTFRNDPIYVIGSPRSGTSLLRLMLTCHPEISIPPEGHFFLWLEAKFGQRTFPEASLQFIDELVETKKFETWGVEKKLLEKLFSEYAPQNFRDAVALVYCSYGIFKERSEFKYWGDKNKLWKEKLYNVLDYFPNSKFVHIVRDGRDVACSIKELSEKEMHTIKYGPKIPDNINNIANHWATNLTFIQKFLSSLEQDKYITVRYEDLILSPKITLTKITKFLQLEFSELMLDYARRNRDEQLEPAATMQWKLKLNSDLEQGNIGKFRTLLTQQDVAIFENQCEGILKYYGYK
jgi:Sulfotransferase family